jgi:hypothetical protein
MSASTVTVKHPVIGNVVGKQNHETVQLLGVKYAHLQDRFAAPELVQYDGNGLTANVYG